MATAIGESSFRIRLEKKFQIGNVPSLNEKKLGHGHIVCVVHVCTVRTPHRHSSRAAFSSKVAFPWLSLFSLLSPCCSGSTAEPFSELDGGVSYVGPWSSQGHRIRESVSPAVAKVDAKRKAAPKEVAAKRNLERFDLRWTRFCRLLWNPLVCCRISFLCQEL